MNNLYSDSGTARRWVLQVGTALVLWLVIFDGWHERAAGWGTVLGGWLMTWVGLVMMLGAVIAGFVSVRDFFLPDAVPTTTDRPRPDIDEVSVVACLSILIVCAALVFVQLLVNAK